MQPTQTAITAAPLLLRLASIFIDMAILSILGLALIAATSDPDALSDPNRLEQGVFAILTITGAVYHIAFNATMSATPGKMAMGLYVADMKGARIRPDTAILRYIVFLAGNFIIVGFVASIFLVLFHPQRRAVHDRIAGTIVLRRPAEGPLPPPDLS